MQSEKIASLKNEAFASLNGGDVSAAVRLLEDVLHLDYEEVEVIFTLNCLNWWFEKLNNLDEMEGAYEKGAYIMGRWRNFYAFLKKIRGKGTLAAPAGEADAEANGVFARSLSSVNHFVGRRALGFFNEVLSDGKLRHDPKLLLQIGRCYKRAGDYDTALGFLQEAYSFMGNSGAAIAECADVHALLGDERAAKMLFREAFFTDPEGVEIESLEAAFITRLCAQVRGLGVDEALLCEWLPVYGALLGVFSVKRELKLAEAGKLKQAIFSLETELRNRGGDARGGEGAHLVPRLLNKYLWLLDYYETGGDEGAAINDVLMKIKLIAPEIYKRFFKIS